MEELGRRSIEDMKNNAHFPIWLMLDDVRSMHNVGSVFRTADAFNVSGLSLCGYTPCPPHRDIHKTALGATETVQWQYEKDITVAIQQLKNQGYQIIAVEQTHNSTGLQHFSIEEESPMAFIFGNEVSGVSEPALELCDACIEIPQWGNKHSLNISVSLGIVLWEAVRHHAQ